MGDRLYHTIQRLGRPFAYRIVGIERVRSEGPGIYVANHLGSLGPAQMILSMPLRFFTWVVADMADYRRAPRYLYDDFVHPTWHLSGPFGLAVSKAVTLISVWLINGIDCIPVERDHGMFDGSLERSLAMLIEGKNLLIFPEDTTGPRDPDTLMHPFRCGFGWLCYLYQENTGRHVPIYPLAVRSVDRTIVVGNSIFLDLQNDRRHDLRKLCQQLSDEIKALYKSPAIPVTAGN
jgi:hypothetical protein